MAPPVEDHGSGDEEAVVEDPVELPLHEGGALRGVQQHPRVEHARLVHARQELGVAPKMDGLR